MNESLAPEVIDRAVAQSVAECGLDAGFARTVRQFLFTDSTEWNLCCGAGCDPCVTELARAVDRARELLEGE